MKSPNILILHTDQQRFDSLGCNGCSPSPTPNIDRFAKESCNFTRHIVANPICMPSRASLLTGMYPPGHGLWTNGVPLKRREYLKWPAEALRATSEPQTIADVFDAAGYRTALFGKLHLTPNIADECFGYPEIYASWRNGKRKGWRGPYYGFNHVELTLGHGVAPCNLGAYHEWLETEHPAEYAAFLEADQHREYPVPGYDNLFPAELPYACHHSNWIAERTAATVRECAAEEKPFLIFAGFPDPHFPFTPCREIYEQFKDFSVADACDPAGATFPSPDFPADRYAADPAAVPHMKRATAAMVYQIDLAVGKILAALDECGQAENTIVVFTSDHGEFLGDHGCVYKGQVASDSLLRVPFLMRAPGAGLPEEWHAPMSNCDVLPTLAALAGIRCPGAVQGENIFESPDHDVFVYNQTGEIKQNNYSIYNREYRYTIYPGASYDELYCHADDPAEMRNLADDPAHRETVAELRRKLERHLLRVNNPCAGRDGVV